MRLAAVLLSAALLAPSIAVAQGDPWNPPVGRDRDDRDDRGDRYRERPIYAGDFVLIPRGEDFLLLDSRTGCVWRRDNAARFGAGEWIFEFPSGAGYDCGQRLANARAKALKEGN